MTGEYLIEPAHLTVEVKGFHPSLTGVNVNPRLGQMVSTKNFLYLFFELLRNISNGSPKVGEVFWAFAVAKFLNADSPKFWRKK